MKRLYKVAFRDHIVIREEEVFTPCKISNCTSDKAIIVEGTFDNR